MISLIRAAWQEEMRVPMFVGKSTDGYPSKDDPAMKNGARIYHMDTGKEYEYSQDDDDWYEVPSDGGGSGDSGNLIVNVTRDRTTYEFTADHTYAEIKDAIDEKKLIEVRVVHDGGVEEYKLDSNSYEQYGQEGHILFTKCLNRDNGSWMQVLSVDNNNIWEHEFEGFLFNPVEVTADMTQSVGYDRDSGRLYTEPADLTGYATEAWVNNKTDFNKLNNAFSTGGIGYTEELNGEITWDGDTTDKPTFNSGEFDYYKISDIVFSADELTGQIASLDGGDGDIVTETISETNSVENASGGVLSSAIMFDITTTISVSAAGDYTYGSETISVPAAGTYFIRMVEDDMVGYQISLEYDIERIHRIGDIYAPSNVYTKEEVNVRVPLIVNVFYQTSAEEYVADRTFNEILEAVLAKREVIVRSNNGYTDFDYTLYSAHETEIKFVNTRSDNDGTWSSALTVNDVDVWSYANTGFRFDPVAATAAMTQSVGYDRETGTLFTEPGGLPVLTGYSMPTKDTVGEIGQIYIYFNSYHYALYMCVAKNVLGTYPYYWVPLCNSDSNRYFTIPAYGYNTIAIGSSIDKARSVFLGTDAGGINAGTDSVCVGYRAFCTASNTIQLGTGENNAANTFQVWNHRLLNKNTGLIPFARMNDVRTTLDSVAVASAQYFLGEQSSVSIVLPSNASVGEQISVVWYNGATAATLSITGTVLPVTYTPSANSRSEINAIWDGTYWAVVTNEQAVPTE